MSEDGGLGECEGLDGFGTSNDGFRFLLYLAFVGRELRNIDSLC